MIHQYKLGDFNIVLDVCSGSVHAVDDVAYDIIGLFEENDKNKVFHSREDIEAVACGKQNAPLRFFWNYVIKRKGDKEKGNKFIRCKKHFCLLKQLF